MTLDESKDHADSIEANGIQLLLDAKVKAHVPGQVIDYIDNLYGKGFVITRAGVC